MNINNGGQVTISNSSFDHCQANIGGGGIYVQIELGGKLTIDGQCNFTECNTFYSGGGIYTSISGLNSLLVLDDGVKFGSCLSDSNDNYGGGGLYLKAWNQGTGIINKVQLD
ncbi:MAG: hypothetical protein EZS28_002262 [Streblomastix strix]|uniref:Right handed beta helix domain-containing protein n=1 Tax=Streblomastix strix TaxID=222440 RepID=A0A5J4X4U1_9EUKA|nr:MAG: hypothetical protein EZS28_002262 [Streblomastix strix]